MIQCEWMAQRWFTRRGGPGGSCWHSSSEGMSIVVAAVTKSNSDGGRTNSTAVKSIVGGAGGGALVTQHAQVWQTGFGLELEFSCAVFLDFSAQHERVTFLQQSATELETPTLDFWAPSWHATLSKRNMDN